MRSAILLLVLMLNPAVLLWAADEGLTPEEKAWLEDDSEARALAVNEGELEFIDPVSAEGVHEHRNRIVITGQSLVDGWTRLYQCHQGLDAVPRAQIVYRQERTRAIHVVSWQNIGEVRVQGASLQLEDVGRDAEVCVEVESRTLEAREDGSYVLRNGPFMRRFLDGYYPMHVLIEVEVPAGLELAQVRPRPQPGFEVEETPDGVTIEAWFAGKLVTEITFRPKSATP